MVRGGVPGDAHPDAQNPESAAGYAELIATVVDLYLWHLTVMVLVIGLAHLLGDVGLHLRPGTGSFWATCPMWIATYAAGLAIFVPVFGRFEQTARQGAAASVPAWRAIAGALGVCAGVAMLALGGIGAEGALGLRIVPIALVLGGVALIVGSPWRRRRIAGA
ncbi:MAG: hypothetical protein BMS9Abin37_0253 [Acidobacteriota bacterium]|nr:MAG: hypothetical protein BMS9Abin37_0253 [Acidobacteriota bacterium]